MFRTHNKIRAIVYDSVSYWGLTIKDNVNSYDLVPNDNNMQAVFCETH